MRMYNVYEYMYLNEFHLTEKTDVHVRAKICLTHIYTCTCVNTFAM